MKPVMNKFGQRRMSTVLIIVLIISIFASSISFASQTYPYEVTCYDSVNMRKQPKSNATVLERISKGESVYIIGETDDYYEITYNNRTGYAMKAYVTGPATATVAPAATVNSVSSVSAYPYETTTNNSVNMRKRADTSSTLVVRVDAGATIAVESAQGDYLYITYNGKTGYVLAQYVNVKQVGQTAVQGNTAYGLLQKGNEGDAVYALQLALIELNYLSGSADGKFGNATENAVKALQSKNKLIETGIVDANLQALLYDGKPLNAGGAKTELKTISPLSGATIRLNSVGRPVANAATRLKELGYYNGIVGETYTKEMQTATKAFQKKNKLTADGSIGTNTHDALYSANAISQASDATPAPSTETYTKPSTTVKSGAKGDDAKLVQQRLKELGYFSFTCDGVFGAKSVAALKEFQKANKIKDDGACGKDTANVLFSNNAVAAAPNASAVATIAPSTSTALPVITADNCVLITFGVSGEIVLNLQRRLTALGYYSARNDGKYLADDMAAVQAFQKKNGLQVDGKAGYATQSLLFSNTAVGPDGVNATYQTLRQGQSGNEVKQMQEKLITLNYLSGSADGKYGAKTAEAVAIFQRANDLVRDGIAGAKTLTLLYSTNATAAATEAPAAASITTNTTVRQGDVNAAVKQMQKRLIELGYLKGSADGNFGMKTLTALMAFQTKNSLSADGVAGKNTWDRLGSSSAKAANETAPATPEPGAPTTIPRASSVIYANWYTSIKSKAKLYPYATVYDFSTGISWQVHMFSLGAHADSEPLTAQDTANMLRAFGGSYTWTPKAVWVVLADGSAYMASTHCYPHAPQHRRDNNFNGHMCIHFPRTQAQVESIGSYATSHQASIDKGWAVTQKMR